MTPNHDIEAERSVLSAVLLDDREAVDLLAGLIKPSDFMLEKHGAIFKAMVKH